MSEHELTRRTVLRGTALGILGAAALPAVVANACWRWSPPRGGRGSRPSSGARGVCGVPRDLSAGGLLCALEPGEELLDLAGPLGLPAPLPETGHAALVGGGFGAGAIYPIARELRRRGVRVTSIVGARTAELLILRELLERASDAYEPCTDDGSLGYEGFTAARLAELIEDGAGFTSCFAVGPMPMMRAVAETTRPHGLQTFVSLDPIMVDGTGMCGGCRVTIDGETKYACVDGPEFDAHKVNFQELADRLNGRREVSRVRPIREVLEPRG